jgi:hypothetical protein
MHGGGTFTRPSGDTYVGEWKDGKRHGQCTHSSSSGGTYVGECRYGIMHGEGTFTGHTGETYVGDWKAGKQHGQVHIVPLPNLPVFGVPSGLARRGQ